MFEVFSELRDGLLFRQLRRRMERLGLNLDLTNASVDWKCGSISWQKVDTPKLTGLLDHLAVSESQAGS
jgi:hypothetical protein